MSAIGRDFTLPPFTVLYVKHRLLNIRPGLALLAELAIFAAFGLFYVTVQGLVGSLFGYLVFGELTPKTAMAGMLLGMLPAALIIVMVIWLVVSLLGKNPAEFLALRWPDLGWLGWTAVIAGFCLLIFLTMMVVTQLVEPQPDQVKDLMLELASSPRLFAMATVSAAVGAPLAEEFLFRGYLFAVLAKSRLGFSGSIVLTAALWALVHAGTASAVLLGVIFIMGCVLGYLLVRFGSLWVSLLCHGVWNLFAALLIFAAGAAG